MRSFAFITTCMGRLAHVKQTVPRLLSDSRIDGIRNHLVFVDFVCPEQSGAWVKEHYGDRASVVSIKIQKPEDQEVLFQKTVALNQGIARAAALGAEYLVFFDADTLVTEALLDHIFEHASDLGFMLMLPPKEKQDLTGFLGAPARSIQSLRGFDERMIGWAGEEFDMRVRLYFSERLAVHVVPHELATPIEHSDELRTRYTPFHDKHESKARNLQFLNAYLNSVFRQPWKQLFKDPEIGPPLKMLLGLPQTPEAPPSAESLPQSTPETP